MVWPSLASARVKSSLSRVQASNARTDSKAAIDRIVIVAPQQSYQPLDGTAGQVDRTEDGTRLGDDEGVRLQTGLEQGAARGESIRQLEQRRRGAR